MGYTHIHTHTLRRMIVHTRTRATHTHTHTCALCKNIFARTHTRPHTRPHPRMKVLPKKPPDKFSHRTLETCELMNQFFLFTTVVSVCIECSFGILLGRWVILWKPLRVPLHRAPVVIETCMTLHNLCIFFFNLRVFIKE